jgi:hypothetical protein
MQSLEALSFNMYVAPRQQYPALYTQSIYMPFELSWGTPNPDFHYHDGFIDGARTYRIRGNRKGSYWATMQVFEGFWGDLKQQTLGLVDFDDLPASSSGDFEIFLGPNPPQDAKGQYWFKTDPNCPNMFLILREVFYDWSRDRPLELHIEALDRDANAPIDLTEDELVRRLEKAGRFVTGAVDMIYYTFTPFKSGEAPLIRNEFRAPLGSSTTFGGNPLACYGMMIYDIADDEALIIEMPPFESRYWGFQNGSVWQQTTDYTYRMGSVNGAQAHIGSDGKFRAVLAMQDPGVPNWLDPNGASTGVTIIRSFKGTDCYMPTVTKVKAADLRRRLPADTPTVTAEQRREAIDVRRASVLRRFGQ